MKTDVIEFGQDQKLYQHKIEDSDREKILIQLYDDFIEMGDITGKKSIILYSEVTKQDVEFEIDIEDYVDDLISMVESDSQFKNDPETLKWIEELKNRNNEEISDLDM